MDAEGFSVDRSVGLPCRAWGLESGECPENVMRTDVRCVYPHAARAGITKYPMMALKGSLEAPIMLSTSVDKAVNSYNVLIL
jgi:hypothetical protein